MPGSSRRRARHAPEPLRQSWPAAQGPPGTEGTVLICPCAAGRWGLADGVQLGFTGVQLGGKVIGGRELPQQREAAAALSRGGRLVMRLPRSGPGTGAVPAAAFAVSAGHRPGLRSRVALPPLLAGEMPARQGSGCVSVGW